MKDSGYGNDIGERVAIDSQGNVIAVGYRAAPSGYGRNGYAIKYSPAATEICHVDLDSGPTWITGSPDSSDYFNDVAVDSQDNFVVVGGIAGAYPPYYYAGYIQKYDPQCNPVWAQPRIEYDSPNDSAWNGAWGVGLDGHDNVYAIGPVFDGWGAAEHEWAIWKYDPNGVPQAGFPIHYNFNPNYFLPDYGYGIAVSPGGQFTAVGIRGVSGYLGSPTNNVDWHVRQYDENGALLWNDSYDGPSQLADYAVRAALDSQGNPIVVGYTNQGTNNGAGANYDWLMMKYTAAGNGGAGQRVWTKTWDSGYATTEYALDVTVDRADNPLVAGNARDAAGNGFGRLVRLDKQNGNVLDEKLIDTPINTTLYGVAHRGGRIAITGLVNNGTTAVPQNDMYTAVMNFPVFVVSPAVVDFHQVAKGSTAEQTIMLRNDGAADLVLGTLPVPSDPFSHAAASSCVDGATLPPNQSCTLVFDCGPNDTGPYAASLDLPSNDPEVAVVQVQLKAQAELIALRSPMEEPFGACSFATLPNIQWDTREALAKIQVQFAREDASKIVKVKASPMATSVQLSASTWKKILLLPGVAGGVVDWKVVGTRKDKSIVESQPSWIKIDEPAPVLNASLSTASKTNPPMVRWQNHCNTKFKVSFGKDALFAKKKTLSLKATDPTASFETALTPSQWKGIVKLVGDGVDLYWYVESKDTLKRTSRTETMHVTLGM